jgi:hypothetical protein
MRIAAASVTLFLFLQACSTTTAEGEGFDKPNSLVAQEIERRVEQIPFQHRDELFENLVWMVQNGEQAVPAMVEGLRHDDAKVRSSCAWVLGRLRDRRTIPALQQAMNDGESGVRLEAARSLVSMGDLKWSKTLIEGLDSDKKEVRYMCNETLKTATGHDFGFDHLTANDAERRQAALRWRQWWGEYSGDTFFAQNYQTQHGLTTDVAAPVGETQPNNGNTPATPNTNTTSNTNPTPNTNPTTNPPQQGEPSTNGGSGGK